jgi:large subunit ribosomal protein L3
MAEVMNESGAPEAASKAGGGEASGKLKGLLGRKLGCTSVFREDGRRVAVTLIEAGPCTVLDRRMPDRDGYAAVQLGFAPKKMQRVAKPLQGHFKKAQAGAFYLLREFRVPDIENYRAGDGDRVHLPAGDRVTFTTKGKGFQGGVKRHHWRGGRGSHGSMFHRAPGSIGASAWPSHVVRGHRMPGQMGHVRRTVQNVEVVQVRPEENLIVIAGAIPGPRNSYEIREGREARTAPARVIGGNGPREIASNQKVGDLDDRVFEAPVKKRPSTRW